MIVTKDFLKQLRQARALTVYRDSKGQGAMTLFFEDEIRGKRVNTDLSYLVDVSLRSYQARNYDSGKVYFEQDPQTSRCHAHVSLYWNQGHHAVSILSTLQPGDEIRFEFTGNAGSLYPAEKGLHHDYLMLVVYKPETSCKRSRMRKEFELDQSICPDNSARMIGRHSGMSDIDPTSDRFQNRQELISAPLTPETEEVSN